MICTTFSSFKARFATRASHATPADLGFVAPDQINDGGGNWSVQDPDFVAGMTLIMVGSALGNDTFTIQGIAGAALTTVEKTVVNEAAPILLSCEGVTFDDTGWEQWPVEYMRVGDTAAAFAGGVAGFNSAPYDAAALSLNVNAGAADAVFHVDEYDWYLSQRTDDPAQQYLAMTQNPDVLPNSYSSAVQLVPTALAESKFGFSVSAGVPIDPDTTRTLFNGVDLYVRRVADQAIQRQRMFESVVGY